MKKTNLFRVLTLVLLIGLLASCSKHTDKPAGGGDNGGGNPPPPTDNYYIKMKMDGAAASFLSTVKAGRSIDNNGNHVLQIEGIKGNGSTDEIDLIMYSANDATTGTYNEGEHDSYYILGAYAPQNRADDDGIYLAGIQADNAAPFKINITELTSTYVKGTFSGAFYDKQGNGSNKFISTEGEFKAPLQ